jgi:Fic family protein
MSNYFSQEVTTFHGRTTPEPGLLAGYAFLITEIETHLKTNVPLPDQLAIVTKKHQRYNTEEWQVFTTRHKPNEDITSHLAFALKYEGIDLYILKKFFQYTKEAPVINMIKKEPTSQYSRRVWFLYEWLMDKRLDIPDLKTGTYVEIVNPKIQFTGSPINSTRHRIKNNLPGTREFCPMIRRTEKLDEFITKDLSAAIEIGLNGRDKELVRRTAAFLLLKDSKASFAIEGEYPPNLRARNWGKAIGQAGKKSLTISELERLQDIMIGAKKLKHMGLRNHEGFIGEHDRDTFSPIPDHISAKSEDLNSLMTGLLDTNDLLQKSNYDPILAASSIAFGFVFIHPFSDGNGRIHRYIIHHILAQMGYTKRGMIFPVSAAILNRIDEYQDTLEKYSGQRIDLIEWEPTPEHNVKILNDTIDLYRYFDLTAQSEFLYECVEETIENIIPEELDYLEKYDRMSQQINTFLSLQDTKVDLLIKFLNQNKGKLSKNKREKEFDELSNEEILAIEEHYKNIFEADTGTDSNSSDYTYKITEEEVNANLGKSTLEIELNKKVTEVELKEIAAELRADRESYDKLLIFYYIEGMQKDIAWATSHYKPLLKIDILGSTTEQDNLTRNTSEIEGEIINKWRSEKSLMGASLTLFKDSSNKLYMLIKFKDGGSRQEEITESNENGLRRYDYDNTFGEYYLLELNGNLGMYDKDGKFDEAVIIE